jgi:hypothetical protein
MAELGVPNTHTGHWARDGRHSGARHLRTSAQLLAVHKLTEQTSVATHNKDSRFYQLAEESHSKAHYL